MRPIRILFSAVLGFVCVAFLAQGQVTTGLAITKTCPGPAPVPPGMMFQCQFSVQNQDPDLTRSVNTLAVQNEVPFPGGVITAYPCMQGGVPVTVLGPFGSGTDTCTGAADETAPACGPVAFFYTDQVSATGMDEENGGGIPLPVSASTTNQVLIDACTSACPSCPMPTHALETVVSNCAGPQVTTTSGWTQINLPGADVVLQCALTQRPGTDGVRIIAHSIKVDGVNGGSITSTGKNGIQLSAGTVAPSACDARATVDIESAAVLDNNPNGNIKITACGGISVNDSNLSSAGAVVSATSTNGQICANHDTFFGNRVSLEAQGDLTMTQSQVQTIGPRDLIELISDSGSVRAGSAPPCANRFNGGIESNFTATAALRISLAYTCIDIAENITITARGEDLACGTTTIVSLANAEIRNDFGKTGVITVTACDGSGRIDINHALLVDEGKKGGGPDPNRVSSLNGGTATTNVNCAATTVPTCNARPLNPANNPVSADQTDRGAHHVIGVPRCDT